MLEAAVEAFGDKLALVSSFGAESAVLLHLVAQVKPDIPVLFLDTGMLFGQTLDYRKQLAAGLGLTDVRDLRPRLPGPGRRATRRPSSGRPTPTPAATSARCCRWTGRSPSSTPGSPAASASTAARAWRCRWSKQADGKIKFNPLANWTKADLDAYAAEHDLPAHPLVAQGFPSIGCWPCTKPVEDGQDVRAGRWAGSGQDRMRHPHDARRCAVLDVGGDI